MTAATIVSFEGEQLIVRFTGDSPAYLFRGDEFIDLTPSHSRSDKYSWMIIGKVPGCTIESKSYGLEPGDRLVVATDGLTDNLLPSDISRIVNGAATPSDAAESLRSHLYDNRTVIDDVTAIIGFISEPG